MAASQPLGVALVYYDMALGVLSPLSLVDHKSVDSS